MCVRVFRNMRVCVIQRVSLEVFVCLCVKDRARES